MKRKKLLAKVHILKKRLGLEEQAYRDGIEALFGPGLRSAAQLSDAQLVQLIEHLDPDGGKRGHYPGRPRTLDQAERGPLLRKIEALLADAKRPWAYAHAISRQMFGVQRVEWLPPEKLRAVVAALEYDRRRRAAAGSKPATTGGGGTKERA